MKYPTLKIRLESITLFSYYILRTALPVVSTCFPYRGAEILYTKQKKNKNHCFKYLLMLQLTYYNYYCRIVLPKK